MINEQTYGAIDQGQRYLSSMVWSYSVVTPAEVVPDMEGLEYTAPTSRLHFTAEENREHYTTETNRAHYTVREED